MKSKITIRRLSREHIDFIVSTVKHHSCGSTLSCGSARSLEEAVQLACEQQAILPLANWPDSWQEYKPSALNQFAHS